MLRGGPYPMHHWHVAIASQSRRSFRSGSFVPLPLVLIESILLATCRRSLVDVEGCVGSVAHTGPERSSEVT